MLFVALLLFAMMMMIPSAVFVTRASPSRCYSMRCLTVAANSMTSSAAQHHTQLMQFRPQFPALSDAQWDQLCHFCERVVDWNEKVNLVSRKDVANLVSHHVLPSLALGKALDLSGLRVIDIGTGGGFPGLPLAIMFPQARFSLLDSNGRKLKAVQDMAQCLRLQNVHIVKSRAEEHHERYDLMLGRSVSALADFLSYSHHLLDRSAACNEETPALLYIKGGDIEEELKAAKIRHISKHLMSDLVPGLQTDKFVLSLSRKEFGRIYPDSKINNR